MIDYHIHSSLCNHAANSMESYVVKAIEVGLREICFLDHLIVRGVGKGNSMSGGEIGLYCNAVRKLQYKYQDKIKIGAGLEVDFDEQGLDEALELIRPFSFDVIASSVHSAGNISFVSGKDKKGKPDILFTRLCGLYLEKMDRMLDHDHFDMVCHLDVVKKFKKNPSEDLNEKFDEILSKISYKNLIVEVNTSGYNHPAGSTYPDASLLEKCFQKGIAVTLSSDAHHPNNVGQYFEETISVLSNLGYSSLTGFARRKPYKIPINL